MVERGEGSGANARTVAVTGQAARADRAGAPIHSPITNEEVVRAWPEVRRDLSAHGLTGSRMHRVDAWRMVQRRAAAAGLIVHVGNHSFRATGITAYLNAGGTLENAQAMAAHESPRTTKLYDRTGDEITLDEVERITI